MSDIPGLDHLRVSRQRNTSKKPAPCSKRWTCNGIWMSWRNSDYIINNDIPFEEGENKMKVYYDKKVDALYIKLGTKAPDGVVEIYEGVNLDTTSDGKIVGIEILDASKKMDINTILTYQIEFDKKLLTQKVA